VNFKDFVKNTQGVKKELINNSEAAEVFDFLARPDNIYKMIIASDLGLPVLTAIGEELERKFKENSKFQLEKRYNRTVIGRACKYLLSYFGYKKVENVASHQKKLRNFVNTEYFQSSSIYKKDNSSTQYNIDVSIEEISEVKE